MAEIEERPEEPPPFDYSPYRVLIWISSDNPRIDADLIRDDLLDFLDRDFYSVWRTVVADAPSAVASIARRDLGSITFASIAASDPVIALKKGHPHSLRIHFASDAGRFLDEIPGTQGRIQEILRRIEQNPESKTTPAKFAWKDKLRAIDGDAVTLQKMWKDESTEAILVSRGVADTLDEPRAKLIVPPLDGQVVDAIEQFDKIYIARLETKGSPPNVQVIELDTLIRHFGVVMQRPMVSTSHLAESVGGAIRDVFSPVVRIDEAGQKNATG
ncbi:signal peptide protein, partial [Rhodopirellula sallentina SM41]